MDDIIRRQDAIDALKALPTWWADAGGYYGGAQPPMEALLDPEDAVNAIENLPPAKQEQKTGRWVPCSEQLPEKSGQYYVSGGGKVWICKFLTIPNFAGGWCNNVSNPAVQAWTPLPEEPYKGES